MVFYKRVANKPGYFLIFPLNFSPAQSTKLPKYGLVLPKPGKLNSSRLKGDDLVCPLFQAMFEEINVDKRK